MSPPGRQQNTAYVSNCARPNLGRDLKNKEEGIIMMKAKPSTKSAVSRVNYIHESPEQFKAFMALGNAVKDSSIEEKILDLVAIRASQINGCAFCLDMHVKQAKIHGERELRLYHLAIWRESTLFASRERAALAWTEALTRLPEQGVPDELFERVRGQLSEKEISDLSFAITLINSWNRINIGFKTVPGSSDAAFGLDKAGLS
jgi:AhpD family alkylhydroperoxidase